MRTIKEIKADIVYWKTELENSVAASKMPEFTPGQFDSQIQSFENRINYFESELSQAIISKISLDRLEQICDAEKNGRLVTLPCKVGDTVWVRDRDGRPREMILDAPDIRCHCAKEDEVCMALCGSKNTGVCAYRLKNDGSDIGKAVFLTRVEDKTAPKGAAES